MISMPSFSKGSNSVSATPAQPIQAPSAARMTGSSAVTRPPGDDFQPEEPSAFTTWSTGRRLESTTML